LKAYPAVDVESTSELILAIVDDFRPTAVQPHEAATRIFFADTAARDAAAAALTAAGYPASRVEVADEDWARRSQENLQPVRVGAITVLAPWHPHQSDHQDPEKSSAIEVVIVPSMGFGTGHHETTRLCLESLQAIDLRGARVLDIGTGSGVLAIAADRLGAAAVLGVDNDADAVQSAHDNLALNPRASRTTFEALDITDSQLEPADVVTANLTGALLVRIAERLTLLLRPGGTLILSGILADEREAVRRAFGALTLSRDRQEGEWTGLILKKS
jgi:ribosomal protein L11 methyltransferase